jgi:hypothetical protein
VRQAGGGGAGVLGGTAERLVGGSVLGVFGVPTAHEDDAGRALQAGLELLERSPLPVRAGVGTGEVIAPAGTGPDPREMAGVVLDVAARLKEVTEPGAVVADERTRRVAGPGFEFGAPVATAPVGDADPRARRLVGLAGGPSPGRPRLLSVVGTAGVGKSRLVADATEAMVARHPATTVLRDRCLSAGRGITHWALGEMLREACGISLADPLATAQDRCLTGLRDILGRVGPAELDATVYALAATCGVSLPGSPLERLEPKAVADELARAWPRFATACAAAGPALLVVEDLHWPARSCWRPWSSRWPGPPGPCWRWPRRGRSWPTPTRASAAWPGTASRRCPCDRSPTGTAGSCSTA